MKPLPFALLLALPSLSMLQAGPLRDTYRIQDHGKPTDFEVAKDEVHRGRRPQRIAARANVAETQEAARQAGGDLVLYEKGQPHSDETRRIVTRQIAVHLAPGSDAAAVAASVGARLVGPAPGAGRKNWWLLETGTEPGSSLEAADALGKQPGVLTAEPQLARQHSRRMVPNDPLFSKQWHLSGEFGVNVETVWDSYRGTGMTIGIVDDGLERTHPDLAPNYDGSLSHDFNGNDSDPLPPPFDGDDHGTACAGVAAARGNNGLGVSGSAFEAHLAGLRLIAAPTTDADEADAFSFRNDAIQIKSNSWGPYDNARRLEGPGPLAAGAIEQAAQEGRGGRGTIFVWASGNGGDVGDSSSFDGYASQREVIAVGALTDRGEQAYYSEGGANLLIMAPSSGGVLDITTTDRQGEDGYNYRGAFGEIQDRSYTQTFGGTSSSAPLVAGCAALLLQANPNLGWRDVQEILVTTARQVQSNDPGWITNAAGFHFNDRFGAGLIDTQAAVNLAKTWQNLGPEISVSQEQTHLSQPIPDNKLADERHERTFVFNDSSLRVEHVCLTVDILHASRGQLEITLESPSGTISRMAPVRKRDTGDHYLGWQFMSTHHWGENAAGAWKVRVSDRVKGTVGTLRSLKLELFGSSLEGHAVPAGYSVQADANANGFVDPQEQVTVNFTLRNDGQEAITNLTATLLGTGGVTSPTGPQSYGPILPGSTATRAFSFVANGTLGQVITATLQLQDGSTSLGTATFRITLGQIATATFSSTESLQIPSKLARTPGNAKPYLSQINVDGLPPNAVVTNVRLHLDHLAHGRSADVDMLLVSPGGERIIPLSDVGGGAASDVNLILEDAASLSMPELAELSSGSYRPTNRGSTLDSFPSPAPKKPYGANFAEFDQTPAAGAWKLFTRDDATGAAGGLGGWSLEITYAY